MRAVVQVRGIVLQLVPLTIVRLPYILVDSQIILIQREEEMEDNGNREIVAWSLDACMEGL